MFTLFTMITGFTSKYIILLVSMKNSKGETFACIRVVGHLQEEGLTVSELSSDVPSLEVG